MAESQNLSVQLSRALHARDEAGKHASAVDLEAADAEVARLKALVLDRLDGIASELGELRKQLSAQEVRFKTGEYTEVQYRNATADARRRIAALSRLEESFGVLLAAETEADIRRTSGRSSAILEVKTPAKAKAELTEEVSRARDYVPGKKGPAGVSVPSEQVSQAHDYVPGKKGLAGIPAPKWMLIGSFALIGVGVVAVAVLLLQAVAGPIKLPSLAQRGGGTDTTATTLPTAPPSTAAPTTPVAPASAEFQVPVQLRGANGIGSLFVELGYDASAIEVVRLDAAALPTGTLFEYGLGQGTVSIGAVSSSGLTGDWVVAFVTCRRAAGAPSSGVTTIAVADVQAHRAADLSQVAVADLDGSVNLSSLAAVAPTITFG